MARAKAKLITSTAALSLPDARKIRELREQMQQEPPAGLVPPLEERERRRRAVEEWRQKRVQEWRRLHGDEDPPSLEPALSEWEDRNRPISYPGWPTSQAPTPQPAAESDKPERRVRSPAKKRGPKDTWDWLGVPKRKKSEPWIDREDFIKHCRETVQRVDETDRGEGPTREATVAAIERRRLDTALGFFDEENTQNE
jgi:hypothetical protein